MRRVIAQGEVGSPRAGEALPLAAFRVEDMRFLLVTCSSDVDPDPAFIIRRDVLREGRLLISRNGVRDPLPAVPLADGSRCLLERCPRTATGIELPTVVRVQVGNAWGLSLNRRQVERAAKQPVALADGQESAVGKAGKSVRGFQWKTGPPGKSGGRSFMRHEPGIGRIRLHQQSFLDRQPGAGQPAAGIIVIEIGEQLRPPAIAQTARVLCEKRAHRQRRRDRRHRRATHGRDRVHWAQAPVRVPR